MVVEFYSYLLLFVGSRNKLSSYSYSSDTSNGNDKSGQVNNGANTTEEDYARSLEMLTPDSYQLHFNNINTHQQQHSQQHAAAMLNSNTGRPSPQQYNVCSINIISLSLLIDYFCCYIVIIFLSAMLVINILFLVFFYTRRLS